MFIDSSVNGRLGCLHLLTIIVNNVAINKGVKIFFNISISLPLGIYPKVELLDNKVILFLTS